MDEYIEENPAPAQIPQPQSPEPQAPPRVVTTTHSKWPFVIVFLLVLLLIPVGIFLYGKVSNTPAPSPSPIALSSPSPTPSPTASIAANLKTYESEKLKDISFSGYSLLYPDDWELTEERDEKVGTAEMTLEKDSYAIVIQQGPFDGGLCVYEDSDLPKEDGPYSDKRKYDYEDLKTAVGTLRRDEEVGGNGEIGYAFCQENEEDGSFGSLTKVGAISYGGPAKWADGIVNEMDKIIESIKVLK
jgi:hypothetical protein